MGTAEFNSQLLDLENRLLKFAFHLTLKKTDAQDLVQETYLRVLLNRDKYLDNHKLKTWTFTIMKNIFVDNYRNNYRENNYFNRRVELDDIVRFCPPASDDPHSEYSAMEINNRIDNLKDKLRIPFKMYINGYKYIEIASELKVNIGTVKKRIFLSRKQLMLQLTR